VRSSIVFVLGCVALVGCTPSIGDSCVTSIDCSQQGERLCDTSQPDGYCTVFDCAPDGCPGEAVCVRFGSELDPACDETAAVDPRWPRFERSFCLAVCEIDDDCREGYRCIAPGDRRGSSIDRESEFKDSKVCFRATDVAETSETSSPAVCTPTTSEPTASGE
jgi:hypothetical protein